MNALLMKTSDDVMFAWMCAMFCMCVSYNRCGTLSFFSFFLSFTFLHISFIQSFIDGRNAETLIIHYSIVFYNYV